LPITSNILQYLGEGLQQNQLCVYLSMNNLKKGHSKIMLSQISNLKNFQKENFMIIENSDDYYIDAACDNLKPFEDLKRQIFEKATLDNKKEIRIVCDITNFLFRNKHFDQCVAVEEWWDQTIEELNKIHGLNILLLCLYNSNNFQNAPFEYQRYRINDNHSIICDSEGIVHSKFDSLISEGRKK
jgi:thymidine kinase